MKKNVLIIFITILSLVHIKSQIYGQTFSVTAHDLILVDSLNSEMVFEFTITNISSDPQTITIVREEANLPANWTSSLCFSLCFAPFVDTISTTSKFGSSELMPRESREFSIHVFPAISVGEGAVKISVSNSFNPVEKYEFNLTAKVETSSVLDSKVINKDFHIYNAYPNPFNPSTELRYELNKDSNIQIFITDILGNSIYDYGNKYYLRGVHTKLITLENLSSGIYFLAIKSDFGLTTQKIVLEK